MSHHHHTHTHSHDHHGHHHTIKNITVAFWLNTSFALIEVAGGLYTNSVSVLSDALHDLGDSLSLGLAWYFQKKSAQKRDENFSYGYRRFSLLGAFINALVLVVGSVFIIREAVLRLLEPEQPNTYGMIVLALLGIGVNLAAMLRLKSGNSLNEKVVSLHFLEDVLGWVAVLIGSIVMTFAEIPVLDPILSILIAAFILFNVFRNLKSAFRIILQGIPENIDESEIRQKVLLLPNVTDIHDVHIWTMDGVYNILTLHVAVKEGTDALQMEHIKREVRHCLHHLNLQHLTIEMEIENEACLVRGKP